MTNGEKMLNVFCDSKALELGGNVSFRDGDWAIMFPDEWWHTEYKEPTTKNDLGVDCISREQALDLLCKKCPVYNCIQKCVSYKAIEKMPSVTPQPRKGHWILTDVESYRVWHCHCSECGKDPQDYIGGSEDWWLIKGNLPKFCPNCGIKMAEQEK